MSEKSVDFLETLIKYNSISTNLSALDWTESIYLCFNKLLEQDVIKKEYINSVIDNTIEHGPYYVICPNVAMPHSGDVANVNDNAFSLITLEKPVLFDKQEVSLLIGFCAVDAKTHLEEALPQICAVFENQDTVKSIIKAKTNEEVIQVIKNIDYLKYLK